MRTLTLEQRQCLINIPYLPGSSQVGMGPYWSIQSQPRKVPQSSENLSCLSEAHLSGPRTNYSPYQMFHLSPTASQPPHLSSLISTVSCAYLWRCQEEVAAGLHLGAERSRASHSLALVTEDSYPILETPKMHQQPVEEAGSRRLVPVLLISCPFTFSPPDGQARDQLLVCFPKRRLLTPTSLVLHSPRLAWPSTF